MDEHLKLNALFFLSDKDWDVVNLTFGQRCQGSPMNAAAWSVPPPVLSFLAR